MPSRLLWFLATFCLLAAPASAATLNFTVATSKSVTVTGTPRLVIDVGGVTRYATYTAGTGTSTLTFSYTVQAGDFDANGVALASPLELNGGNIADLAGNPVTPLSFTLPDTSGINVQTYAAAFTTSPITNANAKAVSFAIAQAPNGSSFSYTIASSGGSGSVTGSGTIGSNAHTVSGVDVSALLPGTLSLSVTISTAAGGTGEVRTGTATPSFTGVLDGLPASAASYSLRRLRSAHTAPLVRVRRSSDNTEQDMSYTIGGGLDTTALTAFCAATSCFARTWYDQSGNGRDVIQASASLQPRIMNAGVVETLGGQAAVRFLGGTSHLAPSTSYVAQAGVAVVQHTTPRPFAGVWGVTSDFGLRLEEFSPLNRYRHFGNYGDFSVNGRMRLNGVEVAATSTFSPAIGSSGTAAHVIGAQASLARTELWRIGGYWPGRYVEGLIAELVMFPATLTTAQYQALEESQGTYYGITLQ